jgi:hypothetical protein
VHIAVLLSDALHKLLAASFYSSIDVSWPSAAVQKNQDWHLESSLVLRLTATAKQTSWIVLTICISIVELEKAFGKEQSVHQTITIRLS